MVPCLHCAYLYLAAVSSKCIHFENLSYNKKQQEQAEAQTKQYHQSIQQGKPVLTFSHTCPPSRAALGPATRASPTAQTTKHARHRPSRRTPLTAPPTRQAPHSRRGELHAPRHTHSAQ